MSMNLGIAVRAELVALTNKPLADLSEWEESRLKQIVLGLIKQASCFEKVCQAGDCSNLFEPKRNDGMYCSPKCRERQKKRNQRRLMEQAAFEAGKTA